MSAMGLLLAASVLVPLGLATCCLSRKIRARAPSLLAFAPIPALLAAWLVPDGVSVFFPAPFRMTLALDRPGAILLGGAALLWGAAGAFAATTMAGRPGTTGFAIWWLLTLTGSLGVFIVADIASFYLVFTLVSLAAYGLIVHEQTPAARRAGAVYVVLALFGEAFLLLAFVMLAAGTPDPNPLIRDAVAALPASPMRDGILALVITGFALKMGLVPLHVWLPLAHPAAPMPASAVLSGVVVNAGVIGLIRFLPFETALPVWGAVLTAAGLFTAYYGVAAGFTQQRQKTILAYSTVSQMGLVAAILGVGLTYGDPDAPGLAAYYGVHHTLVKGSLFLAVGIAAVTGGSRRNPVLLLTSVLALSLAGLPLTSGALAKLAAKQMLGAGVVSVAMTLAAAGSMLLMLHFLTIMSRETAGHPATPATPVEVVPWLVVAAASLIVPWALYPAVSGKPLSSALEIGAVWSLIWPMILGGIAFLTLRRLDGLRGAIPEGDILVLTERCAPLLLWSSKGLAHIDSITRRWPIAGLLLVCLAVLLGGALLSRY